MGELAMRQLKTVYACNGVEVTHTQLDPGQEIPWHKHTEVADMFYAIQGLITIEIAGSNQEIVLSRGESAQVSCGLAHRVSNRGNEMVEFLLIQGIGKYDFRATDDAGEDKTP